MSLMQKITWGELDHRREEADSGKSSQATNKDKLICNYIYMKLSFSTWEERISGGHRLVLVSKVGTGISGVTSVDLYNTMHQGDILNTYDFSNPP